MAKVLFGYDKVCGKNAECITEKLTYTDVDAIGVWAIESVTYCTAAGYLAGSNGAFNPKGTATRAMGAKVLMNMTKEAAYVIHPTRPCHAPHDRGGFSVRPKRPFPAKRHAKNSRLFPAPAV